jgi:hypothetical protein
MKITICGSMQFHQEMLGVKHTLEASGHVVEVPSGVYDWEKNEAHVKTDEEKITVKIEHDLIREHFQKIQDSDAILVLNYDKKGIQNYVGGNTFLEMGLAFWLGKRIYLLYPIPTMDYYTEMHAMQPIILGGDLQKIQSA